MGIAKFEMLQYRNKQVTPFAATLLTGGALPIPFPSNVVINGIQMSQFRNNPMIAFRSGVAIVDPVWLSAASIRYLASISRSRSFGQTFS